MTKTSLILTSLFVISTLVSLATGDARSQVPILLRQWGTSGTAPGQLSGPSGVSVSNSGTVYVADTYNNRVQAFTVDGSYLAHTRGGSMPDTYFQGPRGVAVNGVGQLFVADTQGQRYQWSTNATLCCWNYGSWAPYPAGDGNMGLADPWGIAADNFEHMFLLDTGHQRVVRFTLGGGWAATIQWGAAGVGPGQFVSPRGLALGPDGSLYVTDAYTNRVQVFSTSGAYLRHWGNPGSTPGSFDGPTGVAVSLDGTVYVADTGNHRVQAFTPEGTYLFEWGTHGAGPAQFDSPLGLAVAPGGDVYVADLNNNRIQVFGFIPTKARRTSWGRIKALLR